MLKFLQYCLVLCCVLLTSVLSAQFKPDSANTHKRAERFEAGALTFTPVLLPHYMPEYGFIVSGGGLFAFKTRRNNPYLHHSTIPITIGISTKGALRASSYLNTYWLDNKVKATLDFGYTNMNDHYWGIGYQKGKDVEKGEQTTKYHKKWLKVKPSIEFRITDNFYFGLLGAFNNTEATKLNNLMKEDPHILEYGTDINSSGLGFSLSYDSRDFPGNPWKGMYIRFEDLVYHSNLGSDYNFQQYMLDYSHYLTIIREGSVLAWRIKSVISKGDVPWTDMPKLGSVNDLRGYYWGQYRDNSMLYALIEYRHTFFKSGSSNLSKHGIVYWIGSGSVFTEVDEIKNALVNTGLGYRYALKPRMNLRIDLGVGEESMGLYLSFHEAF